MDYVPLTDKVVAFTKERRSRFLSLRLSIPATRLPTFLTDNGQLTTCTPNRVNLTKSFTRPTALATLLFGPAHQPSPSRIKPGRRAHSSRRRSRAKPRHSHPRRSSQWQRLPR